MRALIQRVSNASVAVNGHALGQIEKGLLVLLGITHSDTEKEIDYLIEKIVNCRLFPGDNPNSDFDRSLLEVKGGLLVVSQFTLYGSLKKGRRPDFGDAARPAEAEKLYNLFVQKAKRKEAEGIVVQTGQFQAHMIVSLTNDGPVTLLIES